MAISTYAELKTAVENTINRTDLTARVPEFITIAESRINRKLRSRGAEQMAYADYDSTFTDRLVVLPSGLREFLDLDIKRSTEDDNRYRRMIQRPAEDFDRYRTTTGGFPVNYCLRKNIEIDRLAGDTYRLRMHYLKDWDIATSSTNALLTSDPDVYLYGALSATELYVKNDPRVAIWKAEFREIIDDLNRQADRSRDGAELNLEEVNSLSQRRGGYRITTDNY